MSNDGNLPNRVLLGDLVSLSDEPQDQMVRFLEFAVGI